MNTPNVSFDIVAKTALGSYYAGDQLFGCWQTIIP
jgi:hypothetical protein